MSMSKSDIFEIGMIFGVNTSYAEDASDVRKALEYERYPEPVRCRAGEISEDQDLVSAILQAKKIIMEVIG